MNSPSPSILSSLSVQVRAGNLQDLVYKGGQAGVTRATVTITFDNSDTRQSPLGYESYEEITVSRQVLSLSLSSSISFSWHPETRIFFLLSLHVSVPSPISSLSSPEIEISQSFSLSLFTLSSELMGSFNSTQHLRMVDFTTDTLSHTLYSSFSLSNNSLLLVTANVPLQWALRLAGNSTRVLFALRCSTESERQIV